MEKNIEQILTNDIELFFTSLNKFSHKVGINYWHMGFQTKYRYNMFGKFKQKHLIEACIRRAASSHGINIRVIYIMPDHVHMLVTLPRGMTDSKALMLLKGASAHRFFKNHPKSRLRLPQGHLWSTGGFAITVGYNDIETVTHYILNQGKNKVTA